MEADQPSTAYARFTKRYQDLIDEHCGPDNNRNREFDRALEILERTCECSNDKMLLPDGKLGSTCQECQDLDAPTTAQEDGMKAPQADGLRCGTAATTGRCTTGRPSRNRRTTCRPYGRWSPSE